MLGKVGHQDQCKYGESLHPQGSALDLAMLSFWLGFENETPSNRSCGSGSFWRKFTANNSLISSYFPEMICSIRFTSTEKTESHDKDCSNNSTGCTTEQVTTSQIVPVCDEQTFVVLETKDHIAGKANVGSKVGTAKE